MACSKDLKDLLKFWVGWEVAKEIVAVEVVNGDLPRAPTYLLLYPQITRALQRLPVFQDGLDYVTLGYIGLCASMVLGIFNFDYSAAGTAYFFSNVHPFIVALFMQRKCFSSTLAYA
ncbi:hypothetical protein AMELA_G00095470 [Ameiurus melas]|uniref:Uncharacterized protein n=1 Tax=Ameiurus melas TaxID=219545 RepID=A0A7J6AX31_AMEME|nr:hypothetical protein AMELA_G00095470 [Ameiurus melas]